MGMEEHLILLETKIAHQELAIEELQKTALEQQKAYEKLEKIVTVLKQRIDAVATGEALVGPGDEKPPHY